MTLGFVLMQFWAYINRSYTSSQFLCNIIVFLTSRWRGYISRAFTFINVLTLKIHTVPIFSHSFAYFLRWNLKIFGYLLYHSLTVLYLSQLYWLTLKLKRVATLLLHLDIEFRQLYFLNLVCCTSLLSFGWFILSIWLNWVLLVIFSQNAMDMMLFEHELSCSRILLIFFCILSWIYWANIAVKCTLYMLFLYWIFLLLHIQFYIKVIDCLGKLIA